jgi:hypothetical protein
MYPALARGHATQFINKLPDYSEIDKWFANRKSNKAIDSFAESCLSKKPGRCTKRIAPLLRPAYEDPYIAKWEKIKKYLVADSYLSAQDNLVFRTDQPGFELFQERSVFYSTLLITNDEFETEGTNVTVANISHHAIQRLLERDITTPQTLRRTIKTALLSVRTIGVFAMGIRLDPKINWSFLVPYRTGALATVLMQVAPSAKLRDEPREVSSIRTFLSEDMLTDEHRYRMRGYEEAFVLDGATGDTAKAWLRKSARPYHFATLDAAG